MADSFIAELLACHGNFSPLKKLVLDQFFLKILVQVARINFSEKWSVFENFGPGAYKQWCPTKRG